MQNKVITYIRNRGMFGLAVLLYKKLFFHFYKRKFKSCGKLHVQSPFNIEGHRHIAIGDNFQSGVGLRLEAISYYNGIAYTPSITIGNNVIINDNVHICCTSKVTIGDNVLMASKIFISDHNHGYYDDRHVQDQESPSIPPVLRKLTHDSQVVVEDNVWIGEFVSILPGTRIGKGSIIGCNSVVIHDVPEYTIVAGVPAKPVKKYDFTQNRWIRYETAPSRSSFTSDTVTK